MKRAALVALSLGLTCTFAGAAPVERTWRADYDFSVGSAGPVIYDGHDLVVSLARDWNRVESAIIVARDPETGDLLWTRPFKRGKEGGFLTDAQLSPDRSTLVASGCRQLAGDETAWVLFALDASSGERRWHRVEKDRPQLCPYSVSYSPDGEGVFVTGTAPSDIRTAAYDALTGRRLWRTPFRNSYEPLGMQVAPDGGTVFVTGWGGRRTGYDWVTIAFSRLTGEPLWKRRYASKGSGDDGSNDLRVTANCVVVAGLRDMNGRDTDPGAICYNPKSGDTKWTTFMDTRGSETQSFMDMSPEDSSAYVFGYSVGEASFTLTSLDMSSGDQKWRRHLKTTIYSYPYAIEAFRGGVAVAYPGDDGRAVVRAFSLDGSDSWSLTLDDPDIYDVGEGLAFTQDGERFFLSGGADEPGPEDSFVMMACWVNDPLCP